MIWFKILTKEILRICDGYVLSKLVSTVFFPGHPKSDPYWPSIFRGSWRYSLSRIWHGQGHKVSTIQTGITSMAHFATDMESRHSLWRSSFWVALGAPVANNWKHPRTRHRFQTNIEKVWTFKRWRRCWRCRCNPWCCGCCAQRGSMDQSHPPWKYWNTPIRWFQIDVLSPITKRWFPGGCLMLGDDGDPQSICYC